ncbi:pollen-specific leucine-rich repeat extensin-like protein 3 [Iris pallida]|uniref:Pollen-specific leucine-rich repeat extensin-like protein 3 n=1 Tax=Iris pallida TaxID=29817 RepID=A0AAX6H708_IRIPA|nr:pollen-specific leucine-rich repeat extensin-like protein 3 [Iris pallida]
MEEEEDGSRITRREGGVFPPRVAHGGSGCTGSGRTRNRSTVEGSGVSVDLDAPRVGAARGEATGARDRQVGPVWAQPVLLTAAEGRIRWRLWTATEMLVDLNPVAERLEKGGAGSCGGQLKARRPRRRADRWRWRPERRSSCRGRRSSGGRDLEEKGGVGCPRGVRGGAARGGAGEGSGKRRFWRWRCLSEAQRSLGRDGSRTARLGRETSMRRGSTTDRDDAGHAEVRNDGVGCGLAGDRVSAIGGRTGEARRRSRDERSTDRLVRRTAPGLVAA